MGFQLGQGFYYGRPSPISKYVKEGTAIEPAAGIDA
jgi:EAL domain-containing protein (putative c-di-GMP-specific phosphodiesterase class I)